MLICCCWLGVLWRRGITCPLGNRSLLCPPSCASFHPYFCPSSFILLAPLNCPYDQSSTEKSGTSNAFCRSQFFQRNFFKDELYKNSVLEAHRTAYMVTWCFNTVTWPPPPLPVGSPKTPDKLQIQCFSRIAKHELQCEGLVMVQCQIVPIMLLCVV